MYRLVQNILQHDILNYIVIFGWTIPLNATHSILSKKEYIIYCSQLSHGLPKCKVFNNR